MKEMNHRTKFLSVLMVGMFLPKEPRRWTGLGKTDIFLPVEERPWVCAVLGKRQMLTEHDWLFISAEFKNSGWNLSKCGHPEPKVAHAAAVKQQQADPLRGSSEAGPLLRNASDSSTWPGCSRGCCLTDGHKALPSTGSSWRGAKWLPGDATSLSVGGTFRDSLWGTNRGTKSIRF